VVQQGQVFKLTAGGADGRNGFPASSEPIAPHCGRSVDVGTPTRRPSGKRKELISRELAKPSDGLEPSTPPYHVSGRY
jgi:hypothetical protein